MTLKDLSRELGVSPSTISRVLNGCTKNFTITDELRQRILNHVKECGYQANPVFQSIKKRNNRQIAILFYSRSSMETGYTVEMMVDRAIRFFDENEYNLHFTFNRTSQANSNVKYSLPPWKCAGLLIPDCHDIEQLSIIEGSGTPYVCMNGIAGPNGTSVIADEPDSMRQILKYLTKLEHKKIAFVTGASNTTSSSYRIGHIRQDVFRSEAQKMGLEPLIVHTELAIDASNFAGANFERADGTPTYRYESPDFIPCMLQSGITAVICDSGFVMELLYWADKAGIRIPEELSVIAYNDQPFLRRTIPPVTTFRIPAEEMGAMASQILYEKLKSSTDYKKGETVSLTGNLVFRESTAPAKTSK